MSIGEKIAARRDELHLSQEALGEKLGVSFQAVSSWERGVYTPNLNRLAEIAKVLGTTVDWLMGDEDEAPNWELRDDMFSTDHMYTQVKHSTNALKLRESQKALLLMKRYHEGQVRKGKDKIPYIYHPLLIACHALALGIAEDDLLATALLHDVVEDCDVAVEDLDVNENIRAAVTLLTFKQGDGESKDAAKKRYYEAMRENKIAAMVKLLDRCNNVSQMATGFTNKKIVSYIEETEKYVFPLLDYVKHNYPEYYDAVFLLKYQMSAVMDSLKRTVKVAKESK